MNNKQKQDLFLYGSIITVCALILLTFSFLMPEKPTYQLVESEGITDNSARPTYIGTVVLDPGHGGYDEGASSEDGRIVEKEFDLKVAIKVKDVLEQNGVQVIMTRINDDVTWSTDNGKDLQARLDIATKEKADLMVSLHCNVSDVDIYNVSGSEVYANADQKTSTALAKSIVAELNKLSPEMPSRGVKTGVLHLTLFNKVPTVIIEMGFVSNPKDVDYLLNNETQNRMVEAIANGIINHLKADE